MTDLNDHLRDALLDHVLAAPDLDLIQKAREAQEAIDGVSLDSLEVSDAEASIDNTREVRSVDRELDGAKKAMSGLTNEVIETVLIAPFEKALAVARSVGMTFNDWNPEHWLDRVESMSDQTLYEQVARIVVRTIDPKDALPWFKALSAHAPWANQVGNLWEEVLALPGASEPTVNETVGRMVDAYLDDDTLTEPMKARADGDASTSVRDVKQRALQKRAFQAFYNQNSSALQGHLWQQHGMDLGLLKWDRVVENMVREIARHNGNQHDRPFRPIDESQHHLVTLWMTRLTETGHLDAWLARPEQWTPVEPPSQENRVLLPSDVKTWMNAHVNAGTFTWTVLVTGMTALNQPGLAQAFKQLGERWSLAHEANLVAQDVAPVARERARL